MKRPSVSRPSPKPKIVSWRAAQTFLRRPGTQMTQLNTTGGPEFYLTPNGGRVSPETAERIRRRASPVDPGLFADISTPQSWRLRWHLREDL